MIKYIRPIFIIGFALAVAYFLYWLGQTKPQSVSDAPPIDVEVEILKPTNHQIKKALIWCQEYNLDINPKCPFINI